MIRDITIGQFYPVNSILHRLDPRVKLFGTLLFIISLFLVNNFLGYVLVTICLVAVIILSKVPVTYILKGLKVILILLLISVLFNLFLTPGELVAKIWIFKITDQGIKTAVFLAIRLIYIIVGSSIMTLTTTPNNLTAGFEKAFMPLNKIRVPVHEMAMMIAIALRFIPILMEETDKIMKAQMARGADFETGNIFKRAKSLVPILIPLFVSSFRRATDLAVAMESRCYRGGEGRTKMKPLKYRTADIISYATAVVYFLLIIAGSIIVPLVPMLKNFVL